VADEGETDSENPARLTVREKEVETDLPPPDPVTTIVCPPVGLDKVVVKVTVAVNGAVAEEGTAVPVIPDGVTTDRNTAELKDPTGFTVTVKDVLCVW